MKNYTPLLLPIKDLDLSPFLNIIVETSNNIVRYDERLKTLPNPEIFLSPLQKKEAIRSSQIEGTQTTLDEILESEADINTEITDEDIIEVLNYRNAMYYAIEELQNKPINLNTIKQIQSILLKDVRGKNKARGKFRTGPVWIGKKGTTMEEAEYIPPQWDKIPELLDNWEKYVHTQDINPIVQTAIIHAQFEMIHPFLDGNGRVGRILIPLYLYQRDLISEPMFYISGYLEKHREKYISSLAHISKSQDWNTWISFFLEATNEQAKHNLASINKIKYLYEDTKQKLLQTKSMYQTVVLDALFMYPIITSNRLAKFTKIKDRSTIMRTISKLEELNVLKEIRQASGNKPGLYVFTQLYNLLLEEF